MEKETIEQVRKDAAAYMDGHALTKGYVYFGPRFGKPGELEPFRHSKHLVAVDSFVPGIVAVCDDGCILQTGPEGSSRNWVEVSLPQSLRLLASECPQEQQSQDRTLPDTRKTSAIHQSGSDRLSHDQAGVQSSASPQLPLSKMRSAHEVEQLREQAKGSETGFSQSASRMSGGQLPEKQAHTYRVLWSLILREDDVHDVLALSLQEDGTWLYLIHTPFASWPRFVIGETDVNNTNPSIILKLGNERLAWEEWNNLNVGGIHQ